MGGGEPFLKTLTRTTLVAGALGIVFLLVLPRHAALASPARHVDIVGAGLFQRQPDELAATLDRGPVIELVAHRD